MCAHVKGDCVYVHVCMCVCVCVCVFVFVCCLSTCSAGSVGWSCDWYPLNDP